MAGGFCNDDVRLCACFYQRAGYNPANPIPEDMLIIRYMSLQALLMLLAGSVFIPSIRKLQETDPLESLLPSECIPDVSEVCKRLREPENAEWLRKRASSTQNCHRVVEILAARIGRSALYLVLVR
jgi:hypothetical protein